MGPYLWYRKAVQTFKILYGYLVILHESLIAVYVLVIVLVINFHVSFQFMYYADITNYANLVLVIQFMFHLAN